MFCFCTKKMDRQKGIVIHDWFSMLMYIVHSMVKDTVIIINIVTTYVFLTNHQWVSVYAFVSLEENKSSLPALCYLQENLAARKRLEH